MAETKRMLLGNGTLEDGTAVLKFALDHHPNIGGKVIDVTVDISVAICTALVLFCRITGLQKEGFMRAVEDNWDAFGRDTRLLEAVEDLRKACLR